MDQTLFYVLGIVLVIAAIALFAIGTLSERFPSGPATTIGLLVFVVLVGATATFAVLNAKDEQTKRREKLAREEKRLGSAPAPGGGTVPKPDLIELTGQEPPPGGEAAGGGGE